MNDLETDVMIIGAGPAGLSAAQAAAERGAHVLLLDDNPRLGGQIWRDGPNAHLPSQAVRLTTKMSEPPIVVMTGARVVNIVGERTLLIETENDSARASFQTLILCTGARERLLPFAGWTLPGVTGAGGLQALIKNGYDVRGQRVVVAGSGPLLLATADVAASSGARVMRIAEQASLSALSRFASALWRWPSKARQSAALANARYRWGTYAAEALGETRLEAVRLHRAGGRDETIHCDRLACGYGLVPNNELGALLGCATQDGTITVDDRQATSRPGVFAAGECTGVGGSELALAEGRIAGLRATGAEADDATKAARQRWRAFGNALARTFVLDDALRHLARPDTLICRCEDVPRRALDGETGWVAAKLANRCGMGACQGRICGPATEFLYGWHRPPPRSPVAPARIETLAEDRMAARGLIGDSGCEPPA